MLPTNFHEIKVCGRVCIFNPITCQCCPHIETSQLICTANQLTGFYMGATLALNGLMLLGSIQLEVHEKPIFYFFKKF